MMPLERRGISDSRLALGFAAALQLLEKAYPAFGGWNIRAAWHTIFGHAAAASPGSVDGAG